MGGIESCLLSSSKASHPWIGQSEAQQDAAHRYMKDRKEVYKQICKVPESWKKQKKTDGNGRQI